MTIPLNWTRRRCLGAGAALALAGCASQQAADYAQERPALDLRRFFDGPLQAQGLFSGRDARVSRRFSASLLGRWSGDEGTLEEDFRFSDGQVQRRVWHLKHEGDGRYTGRADDVVGLAVGVASGNAMNWRYTLALPVGDRVWEVQLDDWLYLIDERTLLNKAVMSKFGVRVGELTVAFQKP
jgi:hypothetical protein